MTAISIIIPAYNSERYIAEAVESALAQTHAEREVIVVNDGSTDGTADVLARYGDQIRCIRQDNRGVAAACNAGVAAAQAAWVAFLDADDIWMPRKLELQVDQCGSTAISHTDSVCFGEHIEGEVRRSSFEPLYSGRVLPQLLVTNFITKSSVMMSRDLYRKLGGFGEGYKGVEDWPLWLRACAEHELGLVSEPLVRYRVHRKSKSMESRKTLRDHLRIINEAFASSGVGASLSQLRKKALASSYMIHSHYAAETGDWAFAMRCALQTITYAPGSREAYKKLIKSALIPFGITY